MIRLVPLAAVAARLGVSVAYARRIAADQGRAPEDRRYPAATHARFPHFFKDGNGRGWFASEQTVAAHFRARGRVWEGSL